MVYTVERLFWYDDTIRYTREAEIMATAKTEIPKKPYQEYPLFAHAVGQWAKKIKGKLWHPGVWANPDDALNKYLNEVDEIQAGRDRPAEHLLENKRKGVHGRICKSSALARECVAG